MFTTVKLRTVLIETPLRHSARVNRKPDVIRLVFAPQVFAVPRVRLDVPPVILVSLNTLHMGSLLTSHVLLNKLLNTFHLDNLTLGLFGRLICPD